MISLLTIWTALPFYIGINLPLSVLLLFTINNISHKKIPLNTLCISIFVAILMIISFLKNENIQIKSALKVLDFFLIIVLLRFYTLNHISKLKIILVIVFLMITYVLNLSNLNENAGAPIILFIIWLITTWNNRTGILSKTIVIPLSIFVKSTSSFFIALLWNFRCTRLNQTILLFLVIIVILNYIFTNYLDVTRVVLGTLFVRFDIWIAALRLFFESATISDILFGSSSKFTFYTNEGTQIYSNFVFKGLAPHNLFIFLLTQFGAVFTLSTLFYLFNHARNNTLVLYWIVIAMVEPVWAFNYLGLLAVFISITRRYNDPPI